MTSAPSAHLPIDPRHANAVVAGRPQDARHVRAVPHGVHGFIVVADGIVPHQWVQVGDQVGVPSPVPESLGGSGRQERYSRQECAGRRGDGGMIYGTPSARRGETTMVRIGR